MPKNFLKQYLVRVGWDLDANGLKSANDKIMTFFDSVDKKLGLMTKGFVQLGILGVSAYTSILKGGWALLDQVAQEDRDMQMLARQYYTTTEAMRAHEYALQQLGMKYEDLFYATDEVLNEYYELARLGKSLEPPEGLKKTISLVNEIKLQFRKVNIVFNYLMRNIAYYIGQNSNNSLVKFRDAAKDFVNWLVEHLPYISQRLGNIFSRAINFATKALRYAPRIIEALLNIFDFVADIIEEVGSLIGYVFSLGGAFDDTSERTIKFKDILDLVLDTMHQIFNFARAIVDVISAILGYKTWKEVFENFDQYGDELIEYGKSILTGSRFGVNDTYIEDNGESLKELKAQGYSDQELLAIADQRRRAKDRELKERYIETYGENVQGQGNVISRLMNYINRNSSSTAAMTYGVGYETKSKGDVTVNNQNTYNVNSVAEVNSLERSQAENISRYTNASPHPAFG